MNVGGVSFQSTLPARGATIHHKGFRQVAKNISIHAPRTGSDVEFWGSPSKHQLFQSTLPARGATRRRPAAGGDGKISIHAPRTGSDGCVGVDGRQPDISIHAPRTGSDGNNQLLLHDYAISIHDPRTGSDTRLTRCFPTNTVFQSTLPARGATTCADVD